MTGCASNDPACIYELTDPDNQSDCKNDVKCLVEWFSNYYANLAPEQEQKGTSGILKKDFGGSPPLSDYLTPRDVLYYSLGINWACGELGDPTTPPENYFGDNNEFWADMWWKGCYSPESRCAVYPEEFGCGSYMDCSEEDNSPFCEYERYCEEEYTDPEQIDYCMSDYFCYAYYKDDYYHC